MVSSAVKRARKKKLAHERQERELIRPTRQMDPADLTDPETEQADDEIRFAPRGQSVEQMPTTPVTAKAATECDYDVVNNYDKNTKRGNSRYSSGYSIHTEGIRTVAIRKRRQR